MASVSAFCYTGAQPVDILKIATFNINGIRSRLPALLEWLEREGPDVVCLQELKAPDAAFPINDIHAADYGAIWHGQASWNGVAILAKGREPARASRRRRRHAQPLSRRSGARRDRRLPVSTERQPAARSQIRLQTGLVRTADQLRRRPLRQRSSSSACGRIQRRSDRSGYL